MFVLRYTEKNMVAYEFYWNDKQGKEHLIGILPERRRDPKRISQKSVMRWASRVLGGATNTKDVYFVQVEV